MIRTPLLLLETLRRTALTMLVESRIKDAVKVYGPKIGVDVVQALSKADPSGKNKYVAWAAKRITKGEHFDTVVAAMQAFHVHAAKLPIKDIGRYKSAGEVTAAVSKIQPGRGEKRRARKLAKTGNTDVVYEDSKWIVVFPKNRAASEAWGSNTNWCISARGGKNYFCSYSGVSNVALYILHDKQAVKTLRMVKGKSAHAHGGDEEGMVPSNPKAKLAVSVPGPAIDDGNTQFWLADDKKIEDRGFYRILGSSDEAIATAINNHRIGKGRTDASTKIEKAKKTIHQEKDRAVVAEFVTSAAVFILEDLTVFRKLLRNPLITKDDMRSMTDDLKEALKAGRSLRGNVIEALEEIYHHKLSGSKIQIELLDVLGKIAAGDNFDDSMAATGFVRNRLSRRQLPKGYRVLVHFPTALGVATASGKPAEPADFGYKTAENMLSDFLDSAPNLDGRIETAVNDIANRHKHKLSLGLVKRIIHRNGSFWMWPLAVKGVPAKDRRKMLRHATTRFGADDGTQLDVVMKTVTIKEWKYIKDEDHSGHTSQMFYDGDLPPRIEDYEIKLARKEYRQYLKKGRLMIGQFAPEAGRFAGKADYLFAHGYRGDLVPNDVRVPVKEVIAYLKRVGTSGASTVLGRGHKGAGLRLKDYVAIAVDHWSDRLARIVKRHDSKTVAAVELALKKRDL